MTRITASKGDEAWMQRALQLARRGEGLTRPNPPVGAVAVSQGKVVGEGYHRKAGGPHAEVVALGKAGSKARGCTLYVTLEPCSTWGRTPPCTDLILSSGVRRVVICVRDPIPEHSGRGLTLLRRKGVSVVEGVCEEEGRTLIAPFARWITRGLPLVTLKLGISVDGKIADRKGNSKWITGPEARRKVHELRRRVDAVLVGAGTVRMDNPSLLPRPDRGRKPWRIVLARGGNIPAARRILTDNAVNQTMVVVSGRCPAAAVARIRRAGADVLVVPEVRGRVWLTSVLRQLGRKGILHVLCEGGSELAEAMIRAHAIDEYLFIVAPHIIGGARSLGAVGGEGWLLGAHPRIKFVSCEPAGQDFMIRAIPV